MFDINCPTGSGSSFLCFSVSNGGALTFSGNSLSLGTNIQSSPSYLDLYGGGGSNAYVFESSPGLGPPASFTEAITSGSGNITLNYYVTGCVTYVTSSSNQFTQTACTPTVTTTMHASSGNTEVNVVVPSYTGPFSGDVVGWNYYAAQCAASTGCAAPYILQNTSSAETTFGGTGVNFPLGSTSTHYAPSASTTGLEGTTAGYWFISPTTAGVPCFSSTLVPENTDCTPGPGTTGNILAVNPMTHAGDLIYGGTPPSTLGYAPPQRLGIGSAVNNDCLVVSSGNPAWSSNTCVTGPSSSTSGHVPTFNGSSGTQIQDGGQSLPAGTIVGTTDTQVLSNKTLTGASSGNAVTLLNMQAAGSAITGNGSAQNIYTYSVPGNTIGVGKCIRATAFWQHSGGNMVTYAWSFGGSSIGSSTTAGATTMSYQTMYVCNTTGTGSQQETQSQITGVTTSVAATSTTTVDTTAAASIAVTFSVSSPDTVTPKFFLVELVQ